MKTLLTEEQLRQGIQRWAGEIRGHYAGRSLTIVGVLAGSVTLLADLIRLLEMPVRVAMILAHRNRAGSPRPGPLVVDPDLLAPDIRGRDVLLVDDIFDTGDTLWELVPQIDELGPTSVRTAVLVRKQGRTAVPMKPDFVAFEIPNEFVVGYGLDYRDAYRHLPYLAVLEKEELGGESGG